MVKHLVRYLDKLEDRVRRWLSHRPILYSLVAAVGIILLWKGIWETAELFPALFGPGSILLGTALLLLTGLLVSFFIGDNIILSGYKGEKKLAERTESEVLKAAQATEQLMKKLDHIDIELHELKRQTVDNPVERV